MRACWCKSLMSARDRATAHTILFSCAGLHGGAEHQVPTADTKVAYPATRVREVCASGRVEG